MRRFSSIGLIAAFVALALALPASAYNPPPGGALLPLLGAGEAEIAGLTVTALDSPWADRLNPAASAGRQRSVLAFGFQGLTDFGGQGFGAAAALGLSIPKPWGVVGAGLRLASTPDTMTDLPLGTVFAASGTVAKALFEDIYVGAGLDLSIGGNGSFGWGAGLDLGFIHLAGDLGFLKDFRWGFALTGIGKGFSYATGAPSGSIDTGAPAAAFPPPFTPAFGAEALLLRTGDWKLGAGAQLAFPSFQDLAFSLQADVSWKDKLYLRSSWGLDAREFVADGSSLRVPSLTLAGKIPIVTKKDSSFLSRNGWQGSELELAGNALPLAGGVWGIGASGVLSLGVRDRVAPAIKAEFPASVQGPAYLSPNADGTRDGLSIPVEIKDQRYVVSYALVVRAGDVKSDTDSAEAGGGPLVRSIANKEARPGEVTAKAIWSRLLYVQKGLDIPPSLVWDGRTDAGSVAPDGTYSVFVEATDDNGNLAVLGPYPVVIDTTPPQAAAKAPDAGLIFSPDGDGNKDTMSFGVTGSVEDQWTLTILDAGGNVVRTTTYKDAVPSDFIWDGKNNAGQVVPDGVYSLVLTSTDRAGNPTTVRLDNIVVNTQQPPINIAIDKSAFSPNGDGRNDSIALVASVPVRTGLTAWRLSVYDANKVERWWSSGEDGTKLPARVDWNGLDASGAALAEGQYQAGLSVWYSNGHSPRVLSPVFVIDRTPPSGSAQADRLAFNPAGAEGQNRVAFALKGSREERWTAEIFPADGGIAGGAAPGGQPKLPAARTWSMGAEPDVGLEWDGTDDQGRPVPDGAYVFKLSSSDRAGNSFATPLIQLLVDTEKKAARLSADQRAFSPNGDGVKDLVRLAATVQAKDKLKSFVLTVETADQSATAMRIWKGTTALADSYAWDGLDSQGAKAPDGRYQARLKVSWQNGDSAEAQTPVVVLDTVAPSVSAAAQPLLFAPDETSRVKSTRITQSSSAEDLWTARLSAADGTAVRAWTWKGQAQGVDWDGTDEAGNLARDGSYNYEISAVDAAGNSGKAAVAGITVDTRPVQAFLTASESGISPNGDGLKDFVSLVPIVNPRDGVGAWRLAVVGQDGTELRAFQGTKDVPARQDWDGKDSRGQVIQGSFTAVLTVDWTKGDRAVAKSAPILVDTLGPQVSVSSSPELFSPDNDGASDELSFAIAVQDASPITEWRLDINEAAVVEGSAKPAERLFISWGGKGMPAPSIVWDGRSARGELVEAATDYPWYFTVTDALGNVTRLKGGISVDVLVLRDGDRLKIKVPSIVFRPNFADFVGLDAATVENNTKVIKRIAQILNRFKGYRIQIEGHANSAAKIGGEGAAAVQAEETKELIPLSLGRAELVRKLLVENGVDASRLSTVGLGSSQPVVDFKDAVNRWKNRRVEFVLIKN